MHRASSRSTAVVVIAAAMIACSESGGSEPNPVPEPTPSGEHSSQRTSSPPASDLRQTTDDVVGVSVAHSAKLRVVRDELLFDAYGFRLAESVDGLVDDPHAQRSVLRVALDYAAKAGDVESIVRAKMGEYPDVAMSRRDVVVGGLRGVAIGPVPGGEVSTNIYVTDGQHVWRVLYYGEALDARAEELLSTVRFTAPARSVRDLALLDARSDEALRMHPAGATDPDTAREETRNSAGAAGSTVKSSDTADEYQIAEGCWTQPTWLFIQTSHSGNANGTGWSTMGTPNFWGMNTHGNWGLGRCASSYYTNDLYAIDYYLRVGDRLYSPFASGVVTYAGWDPDNWWNYGRMVVIQTGGGKFTSLSAHMSAVNVRAGQQVDADTLIGWAGSTGYAPPYPHLHQAFYRWASFSWGRPYGGRGVKQTALWYLGNGGGTYRTFARGKAVSW